MVNVVINSGVLGVTCYLLITRIEKKLDDLIKEIHELAVTTAVARN